jgi:hypothetical protein
MPGRPNHRCGRSKNWCRTHGAPEGGLPIQKLAGPSKQRWRTSLWLKAALRSRGSHTRRYASVNFCPEAWYLQRHGAARSTAAEQRLDAGTRAHQQIGRQTDHLRLGRMRRVLLVTIVPVIAVLAAQAMG